MSGTNTDEAYFFYFCKKLSLERNVGLDKKKKKIIFLSAAQLIIYEYIEASIVLLDYLVHNIIIEKMH